MNWRALWGKEAELLTPDLCLVFEVGEWRCSWRAPVRRIPDIVSLSHTSIWPSFFFGTHCRGFPLTTSTLMPHPPSQNNGIDPSVAPSNYFTLCFSFTLGPPLSHSRSLPHSISCIHLFVAHHITSTSSCHILGFPFLEQHSPAFFSFSFHFPCSPYTNTQKLTFQYLKCSFSKNPTCMFCGGYPGYL